MVELDQPDHSPSRGRLSPGFRVALGVYRLLGQVLSPLGHVHLAMRSRKGKEKTERLDERHGKASRPRPEGTLLWFHCASVGESVSVLPVIGDLCQRGYQVLITSGSVTSSEILARRLPVGTVHQFVPIDRLPAVRRFLDHWKPDIAIWVESEFWPNLLTETRARDIPMALVNARMSARSFRRWSRLGSISRDLLGGFSLCLAQSHQDAEHFQRLGMQNVLCSGNLKFAAAPLPCDEAHREAFQAITGARPLWLAASTHTGEDEIIAEAHRLMARERQDSPEPGLLTIIAPRHPERGPEIAASLTGAGFRTALRSRSETACAETDIYIADTVGEMGLWYRLAPVVFVGGSLVPHGGQNPLEPARLDCALLCGPWMHNFTEIREQMEACQALHIIDSAERLAEEAAELLADPEKRRVQAEAALKVANSRQETLTHVLNGLQPWLDALPNPKVG